MAVDLSIKPDSVAPSLQRHCSTFITTTRNSAPVLRIGATGSHVPHKSLKQVHAAFMPDAV